MSKTKVCDRCTEDKSIDAFYKQGNKPVPNCKQCYSDKGKILRDSKGKIRGLLCITCNKGLAKLEKDQQVLYNLIRYAEDRIFNSNFILISQSPESLHV